MDRLERIEIGKKLYVTAFMVVLWADMVLTIVRNGLHFAVGSVVIGILAIPVLLYLANWLHSGNRTARTATLGFIAVQLLLAILGLKLLPALNTLNEQVGPYCATIAVIRLLLYGGWGAMLLYSPRVQEFLAHQRGEAQEPEKTKEDLTITPTGTAVPLSAEQLEGIGALGSLIQIAAFVAIVAGLLQLVSASKGGMTGLFQAIEGAVMLVLGVFLLSPATGLRKLGMPGADMAYLTNALGALAMFFKRQLVLALIVALILIAGIVVAVI
jgi:hypothetical protein